MILKKKFRAPSYQANISPFFITKELKLLEASDTVAHQEKKAYFLAYKHIYGDLI